MNLSTYPKTYRYFDLDFTNALDSQINDMVQEKTYDFGEGKISVKLFNSSNKTYYEPVVAIMGSTNACYSLPPIWRATKEYLDTEKVRNLFSLVLENKK